MGHQLRVPHHAIDPATNTVAQQFFGPGGDAIRAGRGSVWLSNLRQGNVWRLDPKRIEATVHNRTQGRLVHRCATCRSRAERWPPPGHVAKRELYRIVLLRPAHSCFLSPASARAQTSPDLSGKWALNRALSQFPSELGFDANFRSMAVDEQEAAERGGRGRRPPSRIPLPESADEGARKQQLTDEVRDPAPNLADHRHAGRGDVRRRPRALAHVSPERQGGTDSARWRRRRDNRAARGGSAAGVVRGRAGAPESATRSRGRTTRLVSSWRPRSWIAGTPTR